MLQSWDSITSFVLDGELAIPTDSGFSFDALVTRLRVRPKRLVQDVTKSPAIFIAYDMLGNAQESLMESPCTRTRAALRKLFDSSELQSSPLYLSASTDYLHQVEQWVGHINRHLDGIVAKCADAPYRPGDKQTNLKLKNYHSVDCVIGGYRDHEIGSAHNEILLGLFDSKSQLQYVGSAEIDLRQKKQVGKLELVKATPFHGRQPGEKSHFNSFPAGPWQPVVPEVVVEASYDHFSDGRFRHGCTFLRMRPDKSPLDCPLEQLSGSNELAPILKSLVC
ncbi:MAG: ATP-dependent DNA ligase [Verrucomicrobia bacterium]|nr:ATP-dependent DNA ligase [Verrucomicrobiota bacterium]